ncbi:hypothetical protein V6Z11_D01G200300 [Gossypium hirsutum]
MRNKRARAIGELSTRNFVHRLAASEDFFLRLEFLRKLDKNRGCVNTSLALMTSRLHWDRETGVAKLTFQSGHVSNVFQAKIMPYTDDRSLITCAADGQEVKVIPLQDLITKYDKTVILLCKHKNSRISHKLAVEPGSPHIFYTCGEDGLIDLRTAAATELFTCHSIDESRATCRNPNLFAVAGSDEYTRLYDVRKYKWDGSTDFGQPTDYFCPSHLIGDDQVGITGLAFSDQSELLVSYNDEFIYLFTQDMGLGPNPVPSSPLSACSEPSEMGLDHSAMSASAMEADEKAIPLVYKGHRNYETVKGVSFFGPKSEYVVSGSDCGRIFIWKKKGGQLVRVMEADKHVVNCIESHPHTTVLASSGIERDFKIWTPKAIDKATLPTNIEQIPKRGLFRLLSFAAFNEDDDYNFFLGGGVEGTDDEEDDSDDEYLDFYDDIHDGDGDYNDDSDNDDGDYDNEDVENGDDDDCNDDGDNDDET